MCRGTCAYTHTHTNKQQNRWGGREGRVTIHTGGVGTHHVRNRGVVRHGNGLWRGRGRRGVKRGPRTKKEKRRKRSQKKITDEAPPSYPLSNTPTNPESKPVTTESTYLFRARLSKSKVVVGQHEGESGRRDISGGNQNLEWRKVASMFVNHHTPSDIKRWCCYLLPSLSSVRVDGAVSRVLVENEKRGKRKET